MNLRQYAGRESCVPRHRDNERLFGLPCEPKVIASTSRGYSVLFEVRQSENTPCSIRLDLGDLLIVDGQTHLEYEHSTASELGGPWVNLTVRWISQHIPSCPLACGICCALPSGAQGSVGPYEGMEEMTLARFWSMVLLFVHQGMFLLEVRRTCNRGGAAVKANACPVGRADFIQDVVPVRLGKSIADLLGVAVYRDMGFFHFLLGGWGREREGTEREGREEIGRGRTKYENHCRPVQMAG